MQIALVGADAQSLCRKAGVFARTFSSLAEASGQSWELLALTRDVALTPLSAPSRVRSLLLPGDSDAALARAVPALQVVGYGFSPRDTLTLSSFTGSEPLICIQRSLLTLGGTLLEPQELPLSPALSSLSEEHALLLAGLQLLCL